MGRPCVVCGGPIKGRAQTCSAACRTTLYRRRKAARYPADPLAREAWEAERRLLADQAIKYLDALADRIPQAPPEALFLRTRARDLARDLRRAFSTTTAEPELLRDPAARQLLQETDHDEEDP